MSVSRRLSRAIAVLLVCVSLAACQSQDRLSVGLHRAASFDELVSLQENCSSEDPCLALAIAWTSGMPLSMDAIREVEVAGESMGLPVVAFPYESLRLGNHKGRAAAVADMFLTAGAGDHAPSVVLIEGLYPVGTAVLGHKRAQSYRAILGPRIGKEAWTLRPTSQSSEAEPHVSELVWSMQLERMPGFFFRWVPGTRSFAFDQADTVFLHDIDSGSSFVAPGRIDFVSSPDGALFVTPESDGLAFYSTVEVFQAARRGTGRNLSEVLLDRDMDDQYPSVGMLREEADTTEYRVLVSWFEGLAVRDYRAVFRSEGDVHIEPISPKVDPCPALELSIPILSRDGRLIAARDEHSGTTKIYDGSGDTCTEIIDLGRSTSKVAFSPSGDRIAYSAIDRGARRRSRAYLLDLSSGEEHEVPHTESLLLMIPEFTAENYLLVMVADQVSREFRLIRVQVEPDDTPAPSL